MNRASGLLAVVLGLLSLVALNLANPGHALPLYDGVVVEEPYRYVNPPLGREGSPTSATMTLPVSGGSSPAIVAATSEDPPQAQLIAPSGAFVIDAATAITATVTPIAGTAAEQAAAVGNIYNFSVTDQAGNVLAPATGAEITLVLRAPAVNNGGAASYTVATWDGKVWQPVPTSPGAALDMFTGRATSLGDAAVVTAGSSNQSNLDLAGLGVLLTVLAVAVVIGILWVLRRRRPVPQPNVSAAPARRSKRKRKG